MEKNASMEKQHSFSTNKGNSRSTFQWGRSQLNNTISSCNNTRSPQRQSKVDARVHADVQSKGLVSRIVKYHENGVRLNRSMSMNNLSAKSHKFSLMNSTKPELPYKAMKQNVSMTHIAPPNKSAFYGNTLSGLLRSNSVITLQQNDEISSENRPIIHPPVTEKEMMPTRSVLDVLKEISRKRINSDDADDTDASKKYCNRGEGDYNETISGISCRNLYMQPTPLPPPLPSYKRQREAPVDYNHTNGSQMEPNSYLTMSSNNRREAPSPEQLAKRPATYARSNYNNDISSSLSSSKIVSNKRKLFDHDSGEKRQEKLLRYQPDMRLTELSTALNYAAKTPITPLPNTPQNGTINELPIPVVEMQKSSTTAATMPTLAPITTTISQPTKLNLKPEKPKLTLFNKNYVPTPSLANIQADVSNDNNEKADDDDDDAYTGIPFVKPKKSNNDFGTEKTNLIIDRKQKSKLALMLSGLRGEIYLGDEEDELKDTEVKQTIGASVLPLPTAAATTTTTTSIIPTSIQPITMAPMVSNSAASVVDGASATIATTTNTPTTPPKITSPLTGIKLSPPQSTPGNIGVTTTVAAAPTNPAPPFSFGLAKPTVATTFSTTNATTSFALAPSLDSMPKAATTSARFSFGLANKTTTTAASITTTNQQTAPTFTINQTNAPPAFPIQPTATMPTFGNPTTTAAVASQPLKISFGTTVTASTATTATPTTALTFGTPAATTSATTPLATKIPEPAATFSFDASKGAGGFSFGNTGTPAAKPPATETTKAFNFNAPKTSATSGGFSFGNAAQKSNEGGFSFGNSATSTPQTSNAEKSTTPFGNNTFSTVNFGALPKEQHSTTLFGGAANTTTTSNANPLAQAKTAATFSFQQPTTTTPATTNVFAAASQSATSNPFSFGGSAIAKPVEVFSFANAGPPKPIAFGATNAAATAETKSNTVSAFGQNKPLTFGNASSTQSAASNSFSFSSQTNTMKPLTFGSAATDESSKAKSIFSFSNNVQNKTPPPAYGFGNTAAENTTKPEATVAVTKNAFSLTNNNNSQGSTFIFGGGNSAAAATNKPLSTNSTLKPGTTFAAVAAAAAGDAQLTNGASNAFSFGAAVTAAPLKSNSAFGAVLPSQSQTSGANIFGGGFNSNAAAASTLTTPGATTPKPVTAFGAFGGNNQNNTFSFGSGGNNPATTTTAATESTPQAGAFVFGASNHSAPPAASTPISGKLFGTSNLNNSVSITPSPAAAAPAPNLPLFNAAANPAGASATITPAANTFAMPGDRPIRRATRRLTKN